MFNLGTHNGTITLFNPETGNHRVVQVKTQKPDAKFAPGERIISLQTGSCNETDFKGFGFVKADGRVIIWNKHRGTNLEKIGRIVENHAKWVNRLEFKFACKCRRCNRKLTTPTSIESGMGPACAERE